MEHLDWIIVMAYDYYGAWDLSATNRQFANNWNTQSPIADDQFSISPIFSCRFMKIAVFRQLVLGVPFYGRGTAVLALTEWRRPLSSATSASPEHGKMVS